VGGIPEERHPGHAVPSVCVRERVDHARDRRGLAVGDQRGELRRPPAELGQPRRWLTIEATIQF
jgi:hypothetical protein